MKKWILRFMFVLALGFGIFLVSNWKYVMNFPGTLSTFHSKGFCTCYYVMKQPKSYCEDLVRYFIPIQTYKIDEEAKRITTRALWNTHSAAWVDETLGCRVDP